jgi:hypothetical protein
MNNLFQWFIQKLIWLYKCLEFLILILFSGFVEHVEQIGIFIESNGIENDYDHIIQKCKYDKVCRVKSFNKRFFALSANRGYIVLGEGLVNGSLTVSDEKEITEFLTRCLSNNFYGYYFNFWNSLLHNLQFDWVNLQTCSKAWEVGKRHYDLGNLFYKIAVVLLI